MANTQQKDLFTQVRDLGAEAWQKLSDVPGGSKLVDFANETRTRLDEMQKKLRGLDELERRVTKLEEQLAAQGSEATAKPKAATTKPKPATARKPAAKKPVGEPGDPGEPTPS
jgi:phage shock protein A